MTSRKYDVCLSWDVLGLASKPVVPRWHHHTGTGTSAMHRRPKHTAAATHGTHSLVAMGCERCLGTPPSHRRHRWMPAQRPVPVTLPRHVWRHGCLVQTTSAWHHQQQHHHHHDRRAVLTHSHCGGCYCHPWRRDQRLRRWPTEGTGEATRSDGQRSAAAARRLPESCRSGTCCSRRSTPPHRCRSLSWWGEATDHDVLAVKQQWQWQQNHVCCCPMDRQRVYRQRWCWK